MKSPPELWAEVSDAASLARHLGEVGEITITRLEPETTVAWEGERASGTVELAPAGWGTSVTLTAEPIGEGPEAGAPAAAEPVAAPEPQPTAKPEPIAAAEAEPEPVAPEPMPAPEPPRGSWLTRLLRRRAPEPETADADRAGGGEDARPAADGRTGARVGGSDWTGPARSSAQPKPEPAAPEPDPLEQALTQALDSLGSAHHRPFSRG